MSPAAEPLVERIRRGDTAAFEALFREHYEGLRGVVRRYVGAPQIVEEVLQDVFYEIWRRRSTLDPRGGIGPYLRGAARHSALNHLRRERLERRWMTHDEGADGWAAGGPESDLRQSELDQALVEALSALPEKRRLIFNLSRQHGLSYAEISAVLGISPKTVETQMGRALRFLRHRLSVVLSVML